MRLFTKTLILIVILFTLIGTTISVLSALNIYRSLTDEFESKGQAIAQGIADSSTEILLNRNLATMQAVIDQFIEINGVAYVFVSDKDGEIVAHTFVPRIPNEVYEHVTPYEHHGVVYELNLQRLEIRGLGEYIHVTAPILAGVAGFVHVGMDLRVIRSHIWSVVYKQQLLMLLIFLLVVWIAYIAINHIVQPITHLAKYTENLAERDFSAGPDIPKEIKKIQSSDRSEIGELATSFITMEGLLQQYLKDLEETTAARQRIESELNIAHEIQMSMIPKIFPPFPDRREFDLHAKLISAREVGGDFYDFYFIDDEHMCFAIGDVSGKGIPASLFMALTKTLFRATGGQGNPTARGILGHVNHEASRDNASCMFVTAFCGVINTRTGEIEYTNAGHNPPFLVRGNQASVLEKTGDLALGVMEDIEYKSAYCRLEPGDQIVLYTDGVTEAMNESDSFYTEERMQARLSELGGQSPRNVIRSVIEDVREFSGATPQSDDITMLVLRYKGPDAEKIPTLSLRLQNQNAELQRFSQELSAFGEAHDVPEELLFRVRLAMDEVLVNVVRYAYGDEENHEIHILATWNQQQMTIEVQDDGVPFNPLENAAPDVEESLEEREIGGLGIHLVRNMMDEISYRRELDSNILMLVARPREKSDA